MKYTMLLFILFCANIILAQSDTDSINIRKKIAKDHKDSLKKLPYKINKGVSFFKLGFASGVVNFDNNTSSLIFQSGPGMGADITVGFKAHKHVAVGFGGNFISYRLNKKLLDQSIGSYFSDYDYTTADSSERAGHMNKASAYLYASYWLYRPKFIFEFYTKLGFAYTSLKLSNIVYRHKTFSNYSEYFLLNKPNEYAGFLPAAGICGSIPIHRIACLYVSAEYGYYFNSFKTMEINHHASDGTADIYNLNIPQAAHIFQANIGLMLRFYNKVKGHEKKYNQEILDRVNIRNN